MKRIVALVLLFMMTSGIALAQVATVDNLDRYLYNGVQFGSTEQEMYDQLAKVGINPEVLNSVDFPALTMNKYSIHDDQSLFAYFEHNETASENQLTKVTYQYSLPNQTNSYKSTKANFDAFLEFYESLTELDSEDCVILGTGKDYYITKSLAEMLSFGDLIEIMLRSKTSSHLQIHCRNVSILYFQDVDKRSAPSDWYMAEMTYYNAFPDYIKLFDEYIDPKSRAQFDIETASLEELLAMQTRIAEYIAGGPVEVEHSDPVGDATKEGIVLQPGIYEVGTDIDSGHWDVRFHGLNNICTISVSDRLNDDGTLDLTRRFSYSFSYFATEWWQGVYPIIYLMTGSYLEVAHSPCKMWAVEK